MTFGDRVRVLRARWRLAGVSSEAVHWRIERCMTALREGWDDKLLAYWETPTPDMQLNYEGVRKAAFKYWRDANL